MSSEKLEAHNSASLDARKGSSQPASVIKANWKLISPAFFSLAGVFLIVLSTAYLAGTAQLGVLLAGIGALFLGGGVMLIVGLRGEPPPYIAGDIIGGNVSITNENTSGTRRRGSGHSSIIAATLTGGERGRSIEAKSLERLSENISALGQRANFALGMGILSAATGVLILGVPLLLNVQPHSADLISYASHYVPRLSITIIVELVAFFFLRTYARTLTDIRYVQNEVTNVEMKLVALHTSIDLTSSDVTKRALTALINTERNHVLEKGQTSLELERERIEAEGFAAGARVLGDAFAGRRAVEEKKEE